MYCMYTCMYMYVYIYTSVDSPVCFLFDCHGSLLSTPVTSLHTAVLKVWDPNHFPMCFTNTHWESTSAWLDQISNDRPAWVSLLNMILG